VMMPCRKLVGMLPHSGARCLVLSSTCKCQGAVL
jgi:hypothetical protein